MKKPVPPPLPLFTATDKITEKQGEKMAYQDVITGANPPQDINLIIEIQRGGGQNKYEFDKTTGRLTLDRVNGTTARYPADYGYIPGTICEDGDPLDGLLIIDEPVAHGVVVPARPVGVLYMVDDGENDEKIICVPRDDVSHDYIKDLADIEPNFQKVVEQFYSHYKDWKNNWQGVKVELKGWGGAEDAKKVITESIERYKNK